MRHSLGRVFAVELAQPAILAAPTAHRPPIQQRHQQIAQHGDAADHLAAAFFLVISQHKRHFCETAAEHVELDNDLKCGGKAHPAQLDEVVAEDLQGIFDHPGAVGAVAAGVVAHAADAETAAS